MRTSQAPPPAPSDDQSEIREAPPAEGSWRADAFARSRHSSLADALVEPLDSTDVDRARTVCAEVTRLALREFAPGLILLPPDLRQRAQAFCAYAYALFDFARQTGLEGERLSQMNRWEFDLERALEGDPPGQPAFVAIAADHARAPFPLEAFDHLSDAARSRAVRRRPRNRVQLERNTETLASALAFALLGPGERETAIPLCVALLRTRSLLDVGEENRRHLLPWPEDELPDRWWEAPDLNLLSEAVAAECDRLEPALRQAKGSLQSWPPTVRRATAFAQLAGLRLLRQIRAQGADLLHKAPRLGLASRVWLLLRARWS